MSRGKILLLRRGALFLLALAAISYARPLLRAQNIPQKSDRGKEPADASAGISLPIELLTTGLYVIGGESGNTVLRLSGGGLVLVDGKPAGSYDALRAKVRRVSEQPVRLLILTSDDADKTGTNATFIRAGAHIFANQNLQSRLLNLDPSLGTPASSTTDASAIATTNDGSAEKASPPLITYDRELPLRLGGVDLQLLHFGNAHTSGDTVVYFAAQKVIAVGELYAATPDFDFARGGSLAGWGPVLAEVLKLDFDMVVPGTGRPVKKADLEDYKRKIDTLTARVSALVKRGVPRSQFANQLETDDLGWHFRFTPQQISSLYSEFSNTK